MRFALISILFSFISISSTTLLAATFEKVVMVVFENTNYKNVINDKNFSIQKQQGLFSENLFFSNVRKLFNSSRVKGARSRYCASVMI